MSQAESIKPLFPALVMLAAAPGIAQLALHLSFWRSGYKADALGDGLNYWAGPYLALHGQYATLFDPPRYETWFAALFHVSDHVWSYPPSYLLVVLWAGFFSPVAGALVFSVFSCLALWIALRAVPVSLQARLVVFFSPAALTSVGGNQNGALLASLIVGGLFLAETSPILGGALVGLATIKPQLGLLIPIYWLAAQRWRALISAASSGVALCLVSFAFFPTTVWPDFIEKVLPFMNHLGAGLAAKAHGGPRAMIASSLSMASQLGAGPKAANYFQLLSALFSVCIAVWLGWRKSLPRVLRLAALLVLAPLSTPYIWCYDLIPASCGIALMLLSLRPLPTLPLLFLGLAWITPGIALFAAIYGFPTFMPLWLLAGLGSWFIVWKQQQA